MGVIKVVSKLSSKLWNLAYYSLVQPSIRKASTLKERHVDNLSLFHWIKEMLKIKHRLKLF